jgi:hypothetical protein
MLVEASAFTDEGSAQARAAGRYAGRDPSTRPAVVFEAVKLLKLSGLTSEGERPGM